jgi:GNAT superfamily N-acetyltransferase
VLKCFAAYLDDHLIGFCSVLSAIVPHDGHLVATTESLFVDPAYRHTSAFEDLFSTAEDYATQAGCRVLTCGARIGSRLDKVLARRAGFAATHTQHTKWLGDFRPRFVESKGEQP